MNQNIGKEKNSLFTMTFHLFSFDDWQKHFIAETKTVQFLFWGSETIDLNHCWRGAINERELFGEGLHVGQKPDATSCKGNLFYFLLNSTLWTLMQIDLQ